MSQQSEADTPRYGLGSALDVLHDLSLGHEASRGEIVRAAIALAIWAPASAHLVTEEEMFAVVEDLEDLIVMQARQMSVSARERAATLETMIRAGLHPIH